MNKMIRFLKNPCLAFLVCVYFLTIVSAVISLIITSIEAESNGFVTLSCASYFVSAVLLAYSVYTAIKVLPKKIGEFKRKIKSNRVTAKFFENYGYKTTITSLISLVTTLIIVLMNAVSAIKYSLTWYLTLAVYYFLLLTLKGAILFLRGKVNKNARLSLSEKKLFSWRLYLAVGALLIVLEFATAAVVGVMLFNKRPIESGNIMAISTAAYAFYKMSMSIYNLKRARRFKSPTVQALRNLNFADACTSIFSLTMLLSDTFLNGNNIDFIKIGVGIACLGAIIALASVMIIRAKKNVIAIKGELKNER